MHFRHPGAARDADAPADMRRMLDLLSAHHEVTSELSLPYLLDRILGAACRLIGAPCGELTVYERDGSSAQVIRHGGCDAGKAATSLLRAQIRGRDEVFGDMMLCAPAARVFTADDQELLGAFATSAGTAVDNAQLYEDARRGRDWLQASAAIARALLADSAADTAGEVVSSALQVEEADFAALILPTDDHRLEVTAAVGRGAERFRGLVFDPAQSPIGEAIREGRHVLVDHIDDIATPHFVNSSDYGPAIVAPLIDAHGVRGAVVLIRTSDRAPFTTRDLELVKTFADQVAVALDRDEARAEAESLRTLQDRHRVAAELHDHVIQRLFATGVGLERLAQHRLPDDLAHRLREHIEVLDDTIAEIRHRIFGSRAHSDGEDVRPRRARLPRTQGSGDGSGNGSAGGSGGDSGGGPGNGSGEAPGESPGKAPVE